MIVEIYKDTVRTTVNEELFEAKYKKKGWKIAKYDTADKPEIELSAEEFVVKEAKEEKVVNLEASKKPKAKKFDDNLIKS